MGEGWLIADIAQWVVIACLSLVMLAPSRRLDLLRLGPAGARPLADGPPIGTRLKQLSAKCLDGSPWTVSFPRRKGVILIFISPQCQTCNALLPQVKGFLRTRPDQLVTLVSTIDDGPVNQADIAYRRIEGLPYILGRQLAERLDIAATPYAVQLNESGTVVATGIINSCETLIQFSSQVGRQEPGAVILPMRAAE